MWEGTLVSRTALHARVSMYYLNITAVTPMLSPSMFRTLFAALYILCSIMHTS